MLIRVLTLAAALTMTASTLGQRYKPASGDIVQIWRHKFAVRDLPKARETILRSLVPMLSKDRVVRMTILADNPKTGEILSIQFSDAYNVASRATVPMDEFIAAMAPVYAISQGPYSVVENQIYGVSDEGVTPKPGDLALLWWHSLRPEGHQVARNHFLNKIIPILPRDRNRRNTYFMEGDKPGSLANIAISDPRTGNQAVHRAAVNPIRRFYVSPMRVESFRIFSVTRESKSR
jgi:hypothetical protein